MPPFLTFDPIDVETLEGDLRHSEATSAVVSYQGVVRRDRVGERAVEALFFKTQELVAEREMAKVLEEARGRWPGSEVIARHRLGRVPVGDTSLLLVVAAAKSAEAFHACHYVLEQMRARVPFLKQDLYSDGSSQWSTVSRETLLVSDAELTIPQS